MDHDSSTVTVDDAVHHFSDLLIRVEKRGEEIAIVRDGNVIARVLPAERKIKTVGDLRKAWANRTRLDPEDAAQWEKELEELRAMTPMPPSAWD